MHRIDLPDWAVERGHRMNRFDRIDPAGTALIVIDMQNGFMLPGQPFGNPHACDIVDNVNRLVRAMRAAGGRVLWTRQTITDDPAYAHPAWHYDPADPYVKAAMDALRSGAFGHEVYEGMAVEPADIVIDKYRYSAFIQNASDIDTRLKALGIKQLVIAGTLTNVCCESSARDAYMLGYKVLFATDATATRTDAEHNAALLNVCLNFADVRTTEELVAIMSAGATAGPGNAI